MVSWEALQPRLRQLVLKRGDKTMQDIADAVPTARRHLYRLADGTIKAPSKAMQAAIERAVWQVSRSDESGSEG